MRKYINRKKVLIILVCLFCIVGLFCFSTGNRSKAELLTKSSKDVHTLMDHVKAEDGPGQLYAQAAVLVDGDTGRVLYGKNEDEVLAMASTTKIMTCILALENAALDSEAIVSAYAASMPEVSLGLKEGQVCTVENLLYSLMLESHNDSAVVIAEHVAGSVESFAKMMNDKAKAIGCESTFFVTPNGLDGEALNASREMQSHGTTAKELALILRYCMRQSTAKDTFIQITTTPSWQFTDVSGAFSKSLTNHNSFLTMMEGASSGKTGFTNKAGYCYVGSVVDGERTFIVALLACGWPNNKAYKWQDMKKLITYGQNNYTLKEINTNPELNPVAVHMSIGEIEQLHKPLNMSVAIDESIYDSPLRVLMREDESVQITHNIISEAQAPVTAGQMAGSVIFSLNDIKLREYPVVFEKSAQRISMEWCVEKISEIFLNP